MKRQLKNSHAHAGTFQNDRNALYLEWGLGYSVYIPVKLIRLYTWDLCILLEAITPQKYTHVLLF